jgi:hypothetical protein
MTDKADHIAWAAEAIAVFQRHCRTGDEHAARDSSGDYVEQRLPDGKVVRVVDHENIARSRLRINAFKWIAARMAPRKYGNARR